MSTKKTPQELAQDTRRVTKFREVVHTLGPAGPTTSDNHWSLYLILEPNQGSVRVNMRAEPGYIDGILDWTVQAYTETTSGIQYWDYTAKNSVRVCDIVDMIYRNGRHLYDMSGGGSGCRWWQYVVLYDAENKTWVDKDTARTFYAQLLFRYHKTEEKIPLHMVQGQFRPPSQQPSA